MRINHAGLKNRVRRTGLTQKNIAKLVGRNDTWLSLLVNGRKNDIFLSDAQKLADICETTIEELFYGNKNGNQGNSCNAGKQRPEETRN